MPQQSLLRVIKRWRRYERRGDWRYLLPVTRGIYILYKDTGERAANGKQKIFHVVYIGVAGVAKEAKRGIRGRLRQHAKAKSSHGTAWTHYSFFEVHDNVSREEILELESFLLAIFRHDPRIELANKQKSSYRLWQLRKKLVWPDVHR
jgi:hypothetical protein